MSISYTLYVCNSVSQSISYAGTDQIRSDQNLAFAYDSIQKVIDNNISLVSETLSHQMGVPDFAQFCTEIKEIYERCQDNNKVSFVYTIVYICFI